MVVQTFDHECLRQFKTVWYVRSWETLQNWNIVLLFTKAHYPSSLYVCHHHASTTSPDLAWLECQSFRFLHHKHISGAHGRLTCFLLPSPICCKTLEVRGHPGVMGLIKVRLYMLSYILHCISKPPWEQLWNRPIYSWRRTYSSLCEMSTLYIMHEHHYCIVWLYHAYIRMWYQYCNETCFTVCIAFVCIHMHVNTAFSIGMWCGATRAQPAQVWSVLVDSLSTPDALELPQSEKKFI